MDFAFFLLTVAFFAASWGFVRLCDALDPVREPGRKETR